MSGSLSLSCPQMAENLNSSFLDASVVGDDGRANGFQSGVWLGDGAIGGGFRGDRLVVSGLACAQE